MEKKILMAVDNSSHSNQSLRYATKMLSGTKDVTFTLFHGPTDDFTIPVG
jgi:hypothetical protein